MRYDSYIVSPNFCLIETKVTVSNGTENVTEQEDMAFS